MRFFKYLILFLLSTISFYTFADYSTSPSLTAPFYKGCPDYGSSMGVTVSSSYESSGGQILNCIFKKPNGETTSAYTLYKIKVTCPSAIQKAISVPRNSGSYVCVSQCQYAIQGCVEVNFDAGNPDGGDRSKMSCNAISTGKECGGSSSTNTGSNSSNDGSKDSTNTSTSTTTGNSKSTSTSNSTTTNNNTNNTSTTTTNTTTNTTVNNTTNTTIDLSSLENTIWNSSKQIIDAINKSGGKGTDLTATNKKLDDISTNTKGAKESLDSIHKELTTDPGLGDASGIVEIGQQQIDIPDQQYFQWSAQCPLSTGTTAISLNGQATAIDSDFSSWCKMAVDVRPFVLAAGAVIAFLIASGVWMGRGE